ncbi:MAG: PAS domain-containing sensor histidine kinase, partial [Desulfobacteraceae bacterium 4572_89]
MNFNLKGLKIAIIGGSDPCSEILDILTGPELKELEMKVLLVADTLLHLKGITHAKKLGIPTTTDYGDVCRLEGIDLILKLKNDEVLGCILEKVNTERVSIIDLDDYQALSFISFLRTEEEKISIKKKIYANEIHKEKIIALFDRFSKNVIEIADKKNEHLNAVVGKMSEEEVKKYYGSSWRRSKIVNEAYEAEEFFPHLGENGKWIFFTAAPIKSPDGKIIGAIETLRDETEDKKAQEEIELHDQELSKLHEKYKTSEKKYRSLFNNNPNPIFIIDCQTLEILDINHRVENNYGYSKEDLLGRPFLDVCDHDDDTVKEGMMGLHSGESILFTKRKHRKKSNESFFVNMTVVNTTYSNRDVFIASTTDITESVEKETQLIQAGKLATLGTMAAGMAHEINQPLNVIQICSDLILKMIKKGVKISDEELGSMARDIIDNVARAAGVIKHVRDFARQSERALKKLNINDPINDVFKVLGHQLTMHSIEVVLELNEDLPQIRAEHNRLEQVFINLVTNAIDAMDEKAEKVEGSVEKILTIKSFTREDEVIVIVSDTGVGMNDNIKRKIF